MTDHDLQWRLARRRQLLRRQQVRRRRLTAAAITVITLLTAAVFLVAGSGNREGDAAQQATGEQAGYDSSVDASTKGEQASLVPGPDWGTHPGPVPILMYHVIGDPAGETTYPDLFLSTADFRGQVNWLKRNGYEAVTLSQVQDAWYDGATLPPKPVVLSFDDGYLGQYLDALPILKRAGWAGLLNLKAEGSDVSVKEVKKMIAAGWEVASHTITHPDLRDLDGTALTREVAGSKELMERELGVEIENFCYPAGMYDEKVMAAVEAAGYRGATTVEPGLAGKSMPFELKRIRIDRGDGAEALAAKLESAGE